MHAPSHQSQGTTTPRLFPCLSKTHAGPMGVHAGCPLVGSALLSTWAVAALGPQEGPQLTFLGKFLPSSRSIGSLRYGCHSVLMLHHSKSGAGVKERGAPRRHSGKSGADLNVTCTSCPSGPWCPCGDKAEVCPQEACSKIWGSRAVMSATCQWFSREGAGMEQNGHSWCMGKITPRMTREAALCSPWPVCWAACCSRRPSLLLLPPGCWTSTSRSR